MLFLLGAKEKQKSAYSDAAVRKVKNRKGPAEKSKMEKIDHVSIAEQIDRVSDRSGKNQGDRHGILIASAIEKEINEKCGNDEQSKKEKQIRKAGEKSPGDSRICCQI
jgi:DNA-directed RNA polymerase subunit M/transcription elongation factor TFIIS